MKNGCFFFKLAPKPVQTGYNPSQPSGWAMCFTFKHCWLYFSLFLYQSASVSHMLTSGSREVKTTILNQLLSRLFNWKNKWYHVSSASPELCYDQGCQVEQWYAWLLIDSIIWLHSVRLPLWKMFQSGGCFHRCGYRLSDSTLTKNRASE